MASVRALQAVAVAVATILDSSATVASLTGHDAPQCARVGTEHADTLRLPCVLYQTVNARPAGGLLGTYLVDVELYACAESTGDAAALLAGVVDALSAPAFAAAGLDAVPDLAGPGDAEPLEVDETPLAEAVGLASTLSLSVFLPPT